MAYSIFATVRYLASSICFLVDRSCHDGSSSILYPNMNKGVLVVCHCSLHLVHLVLEPQLPLA